ncbi:MAG: hypothetical protein ACHQYP_05920 [Nitrospiria bacterium]
MAHCWKDYHEWLEDEIGIPWYDMEHPEEHREGRTCLKRAGHTGLHKWTPDDEIMITFLPSGGK